MPPQTKSANRGKSFEKLRKLRSGKPEAPSKRPYIIGRNESPNYILKSLKKNQKKGCGESRSLLKTSATADTVDLHSVKKAGLAKKKQKTEVA